MDPAESFPSGKSAAAELIRVAVSFCGRFRASQRSAVSYCIKLLLLVGFH